MPSVSESSEGAGLAQFDTPRVVNNPVGWGPISIPERFKDIPYQPFSKSDNLGQITDWTGSLLNERSKYRSNYHQQFGSGAHYSYYHEEDDNTFQLVDTTKPQRSLYQRSRARYQNRRNQRPTQRVQDPKTGRMTVQPKYNNTRRNHWNSRNDNKNQVKLKSSVEVRKDWELNVEIEFSQISKLQLPYPAKEVVTLAECGTVEYYDKRYDRITTKAERPLQTTNRLFHNISTADDPVIRELVKEAQVFATDSILSTIMTCPRSYYSWDIIIQRIGSKLFFDKRDDSDFDHLTVNETANDLPSGDGGTNSMHKLGLEATWINQNFSQQCLKREQKTFSRPNPFISKEDKVEPSSVCYRLFFDKRDDSDFDHLTVNETANDLPSGDGGTNSMHKLGLEATWINQNFSQQCLKREQKTFSRPNPFISKEDKVEPSSVCYRYRKFPLGGPGEAYTVICRTEIDAVTTSSTGEEQLMCIKALNEWDLKGGNSEWRQKLDTQRGDILTTEMKNNKCKLAKWTVSSIIAGADLLKFGYITRSMPRSSGESIGHSILSTQQFIPKQFAAQISLDMNNAWGILRVIVDKCMALKDGKYVLYKEPAKPVLRIYKVPQNTFEENEDSEEEDD
eukprot:sb/3463053/